MRNEKYKQKFKILPLLKNNTVAAGVLQCTSLSLSLVRRDFSLDLPSNVQDLHKIKVV